MNIADSALLRAWKLSVRDSTDAIETELSALVPTLVEAGFAREEPWGKDPDRFLWRFTEAGVRRAEELDPAR